MGEYGRVDIKVLFILNLSIIVAQMTKMGSHPASGGYKYRGLVLRDGGWAWG
jgi:hypothetical protein